VLLRGSRFPHFLDNRLTDGDKVVNLKCRPPFTPRKIPGSHFCYRLSRPQDHSAAGRIRLIEKSNYLIWKGTRDQPACSIMLQPTTLPRALLLRVVWIMYQIIFPWVSYITPKELLNNKLKQTLQIASAFF
jgi:hypothetical protein